ncbi:MAG: hypothetical protein K0Q68_42 [Moraxellaceae bacterium]|jgi:hypothetical protein|nr:hypothetical protein [Moraxellaceae bacterium]
MRAVLALLLLLATTLPAAAVDAPRIEILLNQTLATRAGMGTLGNGLALTPGRLVLLADAARAYAVGWGGVQGVNTGRLEGYAYTADGLLLGIRGRQLMYLAADGVLKTLCGLPADGMGISAGEGRRMFLYERNPTGNSALYELLPQRRFRKLLESPRPIAAVIEAQGRVLFAAGNAVFEVAPDKSLRIIAALPGTTPIRALASDSAGKTFYLSDGESVFKLRGGAASVLLKDAGGSLLRDGDALLVLDPRQSLLLRIVNASP